MNVSVFKPSLVLFVLKNRDAALLINLIINSDVFLNPFLCNIYLLIKQMLLMLISRARHCTVYCFSHCNKTFVILALHVSIVHVSNSADRPESKKENEMNPWRMSEPPDFVWEWQTVHSRWCCYLLSGISCESTTRSPVTPVLNKTCTSTNLRDAKAFVKVPKWSEEWRIRHRHDDCKNKNIRVWCYRRNK